MGTPAPVGLASAGPGLWWGSGKEAQEGKDTPPAFPAKPMAFLSCCHLSRSGVFPRSVPVLRYEVIKPRRKNRHSVPATIKLQGSCDSASAPTLLLPAMALLQLRLVTQRWTRSTSWLATGCWQAVHVMDRERCFSARQGRHRR